MDITPEDLLVAVWIPTYKARISVLQDQLAQIRSTLFVLERISKFPFDLFGEHAGPFWDLVRQSFETSVVVGLWRVLFDTDGNSLTLRQLRNQVVANALDESARRQLAKELRSRKVDTRIRQVEDKISDLRHRHFAHLDAAAVTGVTVGSHITFEELGRLMTAAHELINVLGMGTSYMTLYPDYEPAVTRGDGERSTPDVEAMLDDMAARCDDLRMPEAKSYEFTIYWAQLTRSQRMAFNEYRKKFGWREIPADG